MRAEWRIAARALAWNASDRAQRQRSLELLASAIAELEPEAPAAEASGERTEPALEPAAPSRDEASSQAAPPEQAKSNGQRSPRSLAV